MLHLDFSKSAIPRGGGGAVRIGVTGSYFSGLEQTYLEQRSMDLDVYDMYLLQTNKREAYQTMTLQVDTEVNRARKQLTAAYQHHPPVLPHQKNDTLLDVTRPLHIENQCNIPSGNLT